MKRQTSRTWTSEADERLKSEPVTVLKSAKSTKQPKRPLPKCIANVNTTGLSDWEHDSSGRVAFKTIDGASMNEREVEDRIRERAHRIWEQEGCPEGKADSHWELAKFAIAQQDAQPSMLRPVEPEPVEPIEAVKNQGEFPTLTDQGEQLFPGQKDQE
jgi:hypothetical protein